jgi:hypothetical protein
MNTGRIGAILSRTSLSSLGLRVLAAFMSIESVTFVESALLSQPPWRNDTSLLNPLTSMPQAAATVSNSANESRETEPQSH